MVDVNRECLRHYTNGEYRCQACGISIKVPYHYHLHHVKNNGRAHRELIAKETNNLNFQRTMEVTNHSWSNTTRSYLVNTKFKTDIEYPLAVICDDCHTFERKNKRFRNSREIIDYHHMKAKHHIGALAYIVTDPLNEIRAQLTIGDFHK